jgi:tyrosine-protein phosphatase SIW14
MKINVKWVWQYAKSSGYGRNLPNFAQVSGYLYRGGAPAIPSGYRDLADRGFSVVIDLREGASKGEYEYTEANSLLYFPFPMSDKAAPDIDEMIDLLTYIHGKLNINRKVYVHCKGGRHRTGIVIAAYRIRYQGWNLRHAVEEMKKYGWYGELGHQPLLDWLKDNFDIIKHGQAAAGGYF